MILSKLPKPLDLEGIISRAIELQERYPPQQLETWRRVSRYSVLKSTPPIAASGREPSNDDLVVAEQLFRKHCKEMEWKKRQQVMYQEFMKRKRPLLIGLTVFIALASVGIEMYSRRYHHGESVARLLFRSLSLWPSTKS